MAAVHDTESTLTNTTARGDSNFDSSEEGAWELVTGECFPIGALLAERPVHTVHRAVKDTFCFELDRKDFRKLLDESTVFHNFCPRRLASLLDRALEFEQARIATSLSS